MILHDKLWTLKKNITTDADDFAKSLGINIVTSKILLNRGINTLEEAKSFLNPSLKNLHNPFLLKDMDKAVNRIQKAIENKENIWIYGDYDVDGITSVSLLLHYFKSIGFEAKYYIPDRFEEGYGINCDAIDYIKSQEGNLIISVDCGITSIKEVDYANSLGIDFIVTDHHQCQEKMPNAFAVINPKRKDCSYPFDMLAGVGIAFKLVQALTPSDMMEEICNRYLDIVALGTVADVAPIIGENRILVKYGLDRLNETDNVGLKALIDICGLRDKKINTGYIGFVLAPKINAAGRILNASLGVKLLLSETFDEAINIAKDLYDNNVARQDIEKQIVYEAEVLIKEKVDLEKDKVIVLSSEKWHSGVIGIAASRIAEKYYRPTVLIGIENGIGKGSVRSVGNINIFDILYECKDMFIKFGGHAQAAGLSIPALDIDEFRKKINTIANLYIKEFDLIPFVDIDMELSVKDIGFNIIEEIEKLEPYGLGNPKPQFLYKDLVVEYFSLVGKDSNHLKLLVQDGSRVFDCIAFNYGEYGEKLSKGEKIDLVFNLEKNCFKGIETIQFNLKDLRRHSPYAYKNNKIIEQFYLSLPNIIYDLKFNKNEKSCNNIFDYRNVKDRSRIVVEKLDNFDSNLVIINTLNGLVDLSFYLCDIGRYDLGNFLRFNLPDNYNTNNILVNPILSKIKLEEYENIIVYDMPLDKDSFDFIMANGKNVYIFYNESDIGSIKNILYDLIPNRNDLAEVYKYLKKLEPGKKLSILDIYQDIKMNLSKIKLCINILDQAKLLNVIKIDDRFKVELLPPPKEKINITSTDLYKKANNLKERFQEYINMAFTNYVFKN